jgi:hypothetical protein
MAGGNRRPLHALCELTGHNRAVRLPSKPQEWWMPKGLLLAQSCQSGMSAHRSRSDVKRTRNARYEPFSR